VSVIHPITGYMVAPTQVAEVVAPPYDALTAEGRRRYAAAHPRNFLNALRAHDDYPPDERPELSALLAANTEYLRARVHEGAFVPHPAPCLLLYRLQENGHTQTGVVAEMPLAEYDEGRLKRHEHTHREREEALLHYAEVVGARSSPVCVTYPGRSEIDACIAALERGAPVIDHVFEDDGVRHTLWCVEDTRDQQRLTDLFAEVPCTYLTDGHHRSAALTRYAARAAAPREHLLVALFPHDQLRILPYNRCVSGLNGFSTEAMIEALDARFTVTPIDGPATDQASPRRRREFAMLLDRRWYRLALREAPAAEADPVRALDVTILQDRILGPLLGIDDPRHDPRLSYIPGNRGLDGLRAACETPGKVAFAVHPTSVDEVMAVADAGEVMPPKSTWFDPKVRSGFLLLMR